MQNDPEGYNRVFQVNVVLRITTIKVFISDLINLLIKHETCYKLRFHYISQEATFKKFNFRLRAKADSYNDEQRVRHSVMSAEKVNFDTYNRMMVTELRENCIDLPMGVDESKYS